MLARCAPNQILQGVLFSATARNTHPCVCSLSRTSLCARCLTLRNLIRITFSLTRQTLCACDILRPTCLGRRADHPPPPTPFGPAWQVAWKCKRTFHEGLGFSWHLLFVIARIRQDGESRFHAPWKAHWNWLRTVEIILRKCLEKPCPEICERHFHAT